MKDLLTPLSGPPKLRRFIVYDIEAEEWVNPYAVGIYDGIVYRMFEGENCIAESLDYLLRPDYSGAWIYAHNAGNYDALFLFRRLLAMRSSGYEVEAIPIGQALAMLTIKRDKRRWDFLDSAKLMPRPLADLARTFGAGRKLEMDHTLGRQDPRWREYLENDCKITYSVIGKFQEIVNRLGAQVGVTLASTAMDLYRRKFHKRPVHLNRHEHAFIRDAYFGGRTEIFTLGGEDLNYFDVTSHYPSCMLETMPGGPAIEAAGLSQEDIFANDLRAVGIVDCDVYVPEDCYLPPLPVRHNGKLVFPTGRFRGTWDTAELTMLKDCGGRILESRRSIWMERIKLFDDYVDTLFPMRKLGDEALAFIVKILLNSTYGKFAIREERERIVLRPKDPVGLVPLDLEADVWIEEVTIKPQYLCPQLAVHVTALARRRLWYLMRDALSKKDVSGNPAKIFYCDTDSIVTNAILPTGKELGDLKLEHRIKRASFVLPKLYVIECSKDCPCGKPETKKIKAKGFGPGLGRSMNEDEFRLLTEKGIPVRRRRLSKLRESLRRKLSLPTVLEADKRINSQYDKRIVTGNGFDTKPLDLQTLPA